MIYKCINDNYFNLEITYTSSLQNSVTIGQVMFVLNPNKQKMLFYIIFEIYIYCRLTDVLICINKHVVASFNARYIIYK